jgi:porin
MLTLAAAAPFSKGACMVHTGVPDGSKSSSVEEEETKPHFDFEHNLTGDWFGLRQWLYERGVDINGSYVMEPAFNPSGGRQRGGTYLHNVDLSGLFHLDKLIGLPNSDFLVTFSQRSGRGLTQDKIGNAISVQQIYGGGQTYRLVQMRMDHHLFEDRFTLSYGRVTATADFLTSPFYCAFVNNGTCGQPPAPFFNMPGGITAYPQGTWGAVADLKLPRETYVKLGLYDGDPNVGDDVSQHGANFSWGRNGVLVVGEMGWKPKEGFFSMPGRYSFGGYYHTGHEPDVARDMAGGNLFLSGLPAREHHGQEGLYLLFEQMLYRNPGREKTGLNAFMTFVASPNETKSPMPYFLNGGIVWEGLLSWRPADKLALGGYSAWFGSDLRAAQRNAGLHPQHNETDLELNYQVQLTRFLYVRPNIQYVIQPNGQTYIQNALVIGAEVGVTF